MDRDARPVRGDPAAGLVLMKRSACRVCKRVYWAQTSPALGVVPLKDAEGKPTGWAVSVPSEPKTHACWKHRPKVLQTKQEPAGAPPGSGVRGEGQSGAIGVPSASQGPRRRSKHRGGQDDRG